MATPNPLSQQCRPLAAVTVVIPTYNRTELLEICLRHLETQVYRPLQVVVVNNGTDRPASSSSRFSCVDRWIDVHKNEGTARAFNRGIAACPDSPYIFLLNDDAEVEPECMTALVQALEDSPSYSIAVPKLIDWSNPLRLDGAGDEVLLGGGAYRVGRNQLDECQYDNVRRVLSACGAAALYRRSLFEDVGNFDQDYFAYCEDVDLGLRALLRKHRCLFVPAARVRHRGSATMGSPSHPRIIRLTTRNQILNVAKNYPLPSFLRALPRIAVFQMLWMAFAIKRRAFLAWCAGLLGALWLLPGALKKRRRAMRRKLISNAEWWRLLSESEKRIWQSQKDSRSGTPSKLLAGYFWIFDRQGH
jgi:GT2 family glycosyltransferase